MGPVNRSVVTESPEASFELGQRLGRVLVARDFVGLDGQLGAGKTAFSRGVAEGLGVPLEDVSSPTYSIVQTYQGRLTLHHADLYRLATEGDLFSVGYFDLLESDAAMLVEWVSQVPSAKPDDALSIRIEVVSELQRRFNVSASGPQSTALLTRWLDDRT